MATVADKLDIIEANIMSGLKDFQRATVCRIAELYKSGQMRVLVSDEVGLGKTLIARGTVAKLANIRKAEGDNLVKVVYICSNIAIADQNANVVARYSYDAWGDHKIYDASGTKVTSTTHIRYINPYRYRSYYYDTEIAKYYLQSRYYDAAVGRFLNCDVEEMNGIMLGIYASPIDSKNLFSQN